MSFLWRLITGLFITVYLSSCGADAEKKSEDSRNEKSVSDSLSANDTLNTGKGANLTYEQAYNKALTLFPVPFEEVDVKTKFGKAHVIVSGPENGEPLVLLHGMNASSTMWYPNIEAFSSKYRVYAIDCFLEPGKSQYIGSISGMKDIIDWYFEVFNGLNIKKINLIGASRGGWLSVQIALRAPGRVKKLILLSPAQTFGILKPGIGIYSDINYSIHPKRKNLRDFLETMSSHVDSISQIFIDQFYIATQKAAIDPQILKMQPFSRWELKKIRMPVLVLIGDMDIINGPTSLRRAERLCHNAQTATISHAGHFLSVDQPEDVDERVLTFLAKQ